MCHYYQQRAGVKSGHSWDDEELHNSKTIVAVEKDQASFDFNSYSKLNVNVILKRRGYFLGLAIG